MPEEKTAKFLGFDLSTTALAIGVRGAKRNEDFVSTPMQGQITWRKQPAFNLGFTPKMILIILKKLRKRGWSFSNIGALSFSIRQHDMVILNKRNEFLIPALSWQCHVAKKEVIKLKQLGAEQIVGDIKERFILPKLMWALKKSPCLRKKIYRVMTTGDFIGFMMTGIPRLSTSDGLSNGLLDQKNKSLAGQIIKMAGLEPNWFPDTIQSGESLGIVHPNPEANSDWNRINSIFKGWNAVASLGDNHAGALGCGLKDFTTIVVSAGSSGTVNRLAHPSWKLRGQANCFEFYENRLLLMMLPDCATWYNRVIKNIRKKHSLDELNQLAFRAEKILLVRPNKIPQEWNELAWPDKIASIQTSIVCELLLLVKKMSIEIDDPRAPKINRVILTGGLSRSPFFQRAFKTGLKLLSSDFSFYVSKRKGPLAYKPAVLGALRNAERG
jgi:sugar (pentulose or hexulose) kinase